MCAGLGVGQGVVVTLEVVAAGGGDGLELVVGEAAAEMTAGSRQCIIELIIRIIHLIDPMDRLEAALIKPRIVRDQRQPLNPWRNLLPNIWKYRRRVRIPLFRVHRLIRMYGA